MSQIRVDAKACIQCGACVQVCSAAHVFEIRDGVSVAVRPEACWGCGQCVSVCPVDAIDHDQFPLEKCPLIDRGREPTAEQLTVLLRARRSTRTYAERPVAREVVRELVQFEPLGPDGSGTARTSIGPRSTTARGSPSCRRRPSTRFAASDGLGRTRSRASSCASSSGARWPRTPRAAWQLGDEMLERWSQGRDPLFHNAPVVLIGHTRGRRPFARDDAVFAAYNLMLDAERQGLATCQIGIFQIVLETSRKVRRMLGAARRPERPDHPRAGVSTASRSAGSCRGGSPSSSGIPRRDDARRPASACFSPSPEPSRTIRSGRSLTCTRSEGACSLSSRRRAGRSRYTQARAVARPTPAGAEHPSVRAGYHMNKEHWNTITVDARVAADGARRLDRRVIQPRRRGLPAKRGPRSD